MKNTTRKKKERKLLEMMKRATDQSSDGILITNAKADETHAKILYTNNSFCATTGYSYNELIGKPLSIFHGPKTDPKILSERRLRLTTGKSFNGKLVKYRKDGSEFYSECDAAPVFDHLGKITHFIYIMRDVSKQVDAENGKEQIISVVSHELKTPLTSIKGFVEILKRHIGEYNLDRNRQYLSIINTEIDRLVGLTNELLETTRIKTIGVQPDKKLCDLDILIRQVIKNIKVTTTLHKIKRRGRIGVLVNCDQDRINQVITNLLTNAIKYSPKMQPIFVWLKQENSHIVVSIQDFGIGIPMEKQQKIFDRFYRATEQNQAVSSGLGLYIASEIVRTHGGKIWVESTEGKGSIFSFSLPV